MNFTKKTLFWIIVLITLSGTFYLFDEKEEAAKQLIAESLKLLPFTGKSVTEFWINDIKNGHRIKAVRGKHGWRLVEPLNVKGGDKEIEKFLTNIVTARKDAVLFKKVGPAKLEELGLANHELEMGLTSGGKETVIIFGKKGPTLNISYIMFKGEPDVYRVHSDLKQEANKDTHALRNKTILDFDPVKLKRLEIVQRDKEKIVIVQDQGRWDMLEPTKGRASMGTVLESLYAIQAGEIKAFVDEEPSDLTPYGLVSPMLHLTIYQEEKQRPYILVIGDKDRARRGYFARTNQIQKVFDLEEDTVNTILLNMDKLLEVDADR